MPKLADIPSGWQDIVRRCAAEINVDADLLDVDEDSGRLRISATDVKVSSAVRRAFVLAQFRSIYTCSVCGRPGLHRRPATGPKVTRCDEHLPPALRHAAVVYDERTTPWREMSDGRWQYDFAGDGLIPKP